MRSLFFLVANYFSRKLKGKEYQLDPNIPIRPLVRILLRRSFQIAIALLHGYPPSRKIFIARHVRLINSEFITLKQGVSIGEHALIDGLSTAGIKLGKNVSIGEYCRLEASGTITNIGLGIEIGDNTGIGAYSFVGGAGGVKIGSNVIMGQWVSFHPENHNHDDLDTPIRLQGINRQGITIEDDCWIGAKVTFLDGVHVGRGCVIAAGAVVRGHIPSYSIAAGVPAKVIRSRVKSSSHEPKHPVPPSVG